MSDLHEWAKSDGFADWLGKNPDIVAKLFNPNEVRFGALPPAVRDTFYEKQTYGKVEVKAASLEVLADAKRKKRRRRCDRAVSDRAWLPSSTPHGTGPRDLRWFQNVYQAAENRRYALLWRNNG